MAPYSQLLWTWIVRIFVTLGGFAGMTKILEWLFSSPKIIGEVEQVIIATETDPDSGKSGALLLLLLYIVNKRIRPTTIRGFKSFVKLDGKWVEGIGVYIYDRMDFLRADIDFSNSRLIEIAAKNLLEYGKGVRGWLRFSFPNLKGDDINGRDLKLQMKDAFGKIHTIKYTIPAKGHFEKSLHYFPGSGLQPPSEPKKPTSFTSQT
jgi:hypothetical protein